MTIPNILSVFRIILVPVFAYTYLGMNDQILSVVVLLVSGLTDLADGYIARKYHQESYLGMILDPVADKLTQVVAGIAIAVKFPQMFLAIGVLLVKEIASVCAGAYIMKKGMKVFPSEMIGKVSTFFLYGAFAVLLAFPSMGTVAVWIVSAISAGLLLAAFFTYIRIFVRLLRRDQDILA